MARKPVDPSPSQVAEEAMPGWKAVNEVSLEPGSAASADAGDYHNDSAEAADAVMPSIKQLQAKYFGAARADAVAEATGRDAAAADASDMSLVELESGPLKKTVAISKSKKKVIWSQG